MTTAERLAMAQEDEACTAAREVEVLPCNWWPVQVYLRCQPTLLAGMGGAVILGVSAQEVRAACSLLRVPPREWPDTVDGAQALAGMVAKIENERAEKRAKSKAGRADTGSRKKR